MEEEKDHLTFEVSRLSNAIRQRRKERKRRERVRGKSLESGRLDSFG